MLLDLLFLLILAGLLALSIVAGRMVDWIVRLRGEKAALEGERDRLIEEVGELRRALESQYPRSWQPGA